MQAYGPVATGPWPISLDIGWRLEYSHLRGVTLMTTRKTLLHVNVPARGVTLPLSLGNIHLISSSRAENTMNLKPASGHWTRRHARSWLTTEVQPIIFGFEASQPPLKPVIDHRLQDTGWLTLSLSGEHQSSVWWHQLGNWLTAS